MSEIFESSGKKFRLLTAKNNDVVQDGDYYVFKFGIPQKITGNLYLIGKKMSDFCSAGNCLKFCRLLPDRIPKLNELYVFKDNSQYIRKVKYVDDVCFVLSDVRSDGKIDKYPNFHFIENIRAFYDVWELKPRFLPDKNGWCFGKFNGGELKPYEIIVGETLSSAFSSNFSANVESELFEWFQFSENLAEILKIVI